MTDTQLYLAVGLPVFAVLMGFIGNILQVNTINARITSLEGTMNARFTSMDARFDTLVGKVIDVDNRLTRVEALLERH